MTKVPHSAIDSFHSYLMDDDQFNEAMMRIALQVAEGELTAAGKGVYDEEDLYDLAMELCTRVCVS